MQTIITINYNLAIIHIILHCHLIDAIVLLSMLTMRMNVMEHY